MKSDQTSALADPSFKFLFGIIFICLIDSTFRASPQSRMALGGSRLMNGENANEVGDLAAIWLSTSIAAEKMGVPCKHSIFMTTRWLQKAWEERFLLLGGGTWVMLGGKLLFSKKLYFEAKLLRLSLNAADFSPLRLSSFQVWMLQTFHFWG